MVKTLQKGKAFLIDLPRVDFHVIGAAELPENGLRPNRECAASGVDYRKWSYRP